MLAREPTYSLGAWIKQRRRALNLTQQALAQRIGVAEVTVRKIEADERRPSPQVAGLLADALTLDTSTRTRFLLAARAELSPEQLTVSVASSNPSLPLPPTPLIGRADALADLQAALADERVRLLTLTGPPGMGKTRLALALADAAAKSYAGAVTFVPLAPLGDPELVAAALAQALDVHLAPGEPLMRRLISRLQGRQLLVLDNFEQVLPAAALIAELLAGAADLKIVVTSRAALRLRAEHEYAVPALALPSWPQRPDADEQRLSVARAAPAIQLFVARARAVLPAFQLTTANVATVAAICARLDAVPLAIELAAARIRSFSLPTLLARLEQDLDLLSDGPPDLPIRQRSLRGAIAWSYKLLPPAEQRLLQWLGAFVGGFTLDDLEGVLARAAADSARAAPADGPEPPSAVDAGVLLGSLIDHSLVRAEADEQGAVRFSLLETVRAFARERLEGVGARLVRRCHAEQFCDLAAATTGQLTTSARSTALARLERELDNLRAAFDWVLHEVDADLALGLLDSAHALWIERGWLAEGRTWAQQALALSALQAPRPERALALDCAASIALREGDYAAGIALARESLTVFEAAGDRQGCARAQTTLAWGLTQQGDHTAGLELAGDALIFWRAAGDPLQLALALERVAWIHGRQGALATARPLLEEAIMLLRQGPHVMVLSEQLWELGELLRLGGETDRSRPLFAESLRLMEQAAPAELAERLHLRAWDAYRAGDYRQAAALFDENVALLRRRGESVDLAWAINHAAAARFCAGERDLAAAGYEESLARFRAQGHRQGEAAMLHNVGYIARGRGDRALAAACFQQSLAIFRLIGYTWSVADAVAGLAGLAADSGELALATKLLAATESAQAAIDASGILLDPSNMQEVRHTWELIEAGLPRAERERLREVGRALSLEEAAALATTIGE